MSVRKNSLASGACGEIVTLLERGLTPGGAARTSNTRPDEELDALDPGARCI
jgi:hypothetical protein